VRTLELQVAWEVGKVFTLSSDVAYSILSNKTEFVQQGINQVARNVARAATLSWETLVELKYQGILRGRLSFETQKTVRRTGQRGYNEWLLGSDGDIYPTWMAHAGTVIQPPGVPMRAAVTASYLGPRRASATNILLNRRSYLLPRYLLLDATLTTSEIRLPGRVRQTVSFAVSGKNLLGSQGPTPGFSGVDYPLSPRAFFLQTNLNL
jgi:outer membrane receptor for ferrienterochelin and colicins